MELKAAIKGRRSVRKFKDDHIDKKLVLDLLELANMAPSAGNQQPWEFIVLESKKIIPLMEITESAFAERFGTMEHLQLEQMLSKLSLSGEDRYAALHRFYCTLGGAPIVIIAITDKGKDDFSHFLNSISTAAAIQNLLLAAWEKGLGTCWMMGPLHKKREQIEKLLGIPDNKDIIAIIPLGIPENIPLAPPKEDIDKKIKWNLEL